nr:permease [Microbacterium hydrocarbonoxydans]
MNPQTLALLLRPAKSRSTVLALPVTAFAAVTALVLTVVGGAQAFWSWSDPEAPIYQALAAIALVLLVVPLVNLGGAAARLSARRRDELLSTLRLLGVTPVGVSIVTVTESVLVATSGAIVGVVAYLMISPLIGMIPFRGAALGLDSVLLSPLNGAVVVLVILLVSALSAALGLRRVIVSPLGVRLRSEAAPVRGMRALVGGAALACIFAIIAVFPSVAGLTVTIVVLASSFGIALAVLNVIGPWVLKIGATRQLRRAARPTGLLAARIVLDSPKAAWRQVSGIAMTSFIAVFAGTGVSLLSVMSEDGVNAADAALATDIRTGLIITLSASFLMVAASVGVNQAAAVLDQRELHTSLHRLGTPLETVDRARRRAIMSPLLTVSLGSAVCAGILVFPLLGLAAIVAPASLFTIAVVLVIGIGVVWASTQTTRPVLARAFRDV